MWATFCNATENWRQSMKSKTKTILIFAAILAAVFLIAFLDGSAMQSAAEEEEEGTLIGAFVSEEDLDIDDLEVTATGKIQWKRGRLYAEKWELALSESSRWRRLLQRAADRNRGRTCGQHNAAARELR